MNLAKHIREHEALDLDKHVIRLIKTHLPQGSGVAVAAGGTGDGDVTGAASSTDNALVRFDGITGKLIQNSGVIVSDSDAMTGVTTLEVDHATAPFIQIRRAGTLIGQLTATATLFTVTSQGVELKIGVSGAVGMIFGTANNQVGMGTTQYASLTKLTISTENTLRRGLVVRGIAAQSANLQEWRNSGNDVLASVTAAGNITTVGTVDGRDVAADGTKLDGIESGATADQTDVEIETAYNNQVSVVSQAEAEAGSSTTVRRWTAQRVKQAVIALETSDHGDMSGLADDDHDHYILVDGTRNFTGTIGLITGSTIGNLTLADGSIIDSSGAISFGNENLSTTGTLAAGASTLSGVITNTITANNALLKIKGLSAATGLNLDLEGGDGSGFFLASGSVRITGGQGGVNATGGSVIIKGGEGLIDGSVVLQTAAGDAVLQFTPLLLDINPQGIIYDFRVRGDNETNLLFTDGQNDRVAVGTAAPAVRFHVQGTGNTSIMIQPGANSDATLRYRDGGTSKWAVGNDSSNDEYMISTGTNLSNPKLTILQDGKVGVGTPTPVTNFQVAGSVKIDSALELDGDLNHDGNNIGFFGTAPVAKGISGADLTNNVTSGGVDDTINDINGMAINAADFTTTRNAIYQLARKLKQVNDTFRDYGMLT